MAETKKTIIFDIGLFIDTSNSTSIAKALEEYQEQLRKAGLHIRLGILKVPPEVTIKPEIIADFKNKIPQNLNFNPDIKNIDFNGAPDGDIIVTDAHVVSKLKEQIKKFNVMRVGINSTIQQVLEAVINERKSTTIDPAVEAISSPQQYRHIPNNTGLSASTIERTSTTTPLRRRPALSSATSSTPNQGTLQFFANKAPTEKQKPSGNPTAQDLAVDRLPTPQQSSHALNNTASSTSTSDALKLLTRKRDKAAIKTKAKKPGQSEPLKRENTASVNPSALAINLSQIADNTDPHKGTPESDSPSSSSRDTDSSSKSSPTGR